MESVPPRRTPFRAGTVERVEAMDLKVKLSALGVPDAELERIHVLTSSSKSRRSSSGLCCHVHEGEMPAGALSKIGGGLYVAGICLCALQAAAEMDFVELVEYYYEICGAYALPFDDGPYHEREPLTSVRRLEEFFAKMPGHRGIARARRALRYVRDGSRSPMETALIMMLILPRKDGGLGLRTTEMDYRIDVQQRFRDMTTRRFFIADVYIVAARLDIEYHGFHHDNEGRDVSDAERENTLRAMGHHVIVVRKGSFFERRAFCRMMEAIRMRAGVRPAKLPADFAERQERLRQFVLRRML